ncbi:mitochondrial import receptor subunit TOM40 homolog 1-like [Drosophila serrata]|uniref:mitochondrial import receptor subunit TOM40 homolog 1-like n=1 Tax=Drosophila serrata TaxID=7274 RepID=UPI000A1D1317|nr:mitochondrial import receptor subunit TOM40 homolog 1-like [Drosophila serrata]
MGNVLAVSSGRSQVLPVPVALPLPTVESSTLANDLELKNPGTIEELHKKYKDIQANTFEGAKIILYKVLSNHFQVSHSLHLGQTVPSGYRFCATYVGTKPGDTTIAEGFPVILGDIDLLGNLNANVIHQISPRLRWKLTTQIQDSKTAATQLSMDYRGSDFTTSLTIANPSVFTNSVMIVGQYLQSMTSSLALGTELAYQCGPHVPGRQVAQVSVVARYAAENSVLSGTLGQSGLHACYYQRANDELQIGVELQTSLRMKDSVATLVYQLDLPKADLVFKGAIDSNWLISGVLEKRLNPLPFTLVICGRIDHAKNNFRLGCGLMMG